MELTAIIGVALISVVLCLLLRQYKAEYALFISIVCGAVLFLAIIAGLRPAFAMMRGILNGIGAGSIYGKTLIKALGICYLVQLASDSCRDAGQSAIAGRVELAGKAAIVLLSLPMFEQLTQIVLKLIDV